MSELLMMEAALFQLRAALSDDPELLPVRISADLVANAVAVAKAQGVNAARVNDITFALNDLITAIDDAGAPTEILGAVALLQNDAAALRVSVSLSPGLLEAIRGLRAKLKERATAMERSQYREEGTPAEPLPHPPETLRAVAIPLAEQLTAAGFDTPALATLISSPAEVRYHTLNEIVDELDVIASA